MPPESSSQPGRTASGRTPHRGRFLEYFTRHGWVPLLALLLALGGALAFLSLADEVLEGETRDFDQRLFEAIAGSYSTIPPILREALRDLTALGGTAVITLLVTGVTVFLALRRQWRSAAFLVISVIGGLAISTLVKYGINRARPDHFLHHSDTVTPSFPSGHAAHAAVAYLAIAILLTKLVESTRMKAYILGAGLLVPLLVGFSRIALAVHWPTDVLGGWLIGLAWGLLVYAAATYMQKHGGIEPEGAIESEN